MSTLAQVSQLVPMNKLKIEAEMIRLASLLETAMPLVSLHLDKLNVNAFGILACELFSIRQVELDSGSHNRRR
ncbi:hypothetical protein IMCC3317_13870 [Kordia antarctica]|uniref:Uncharacterized protein n=1 Tax=Kordia antarctica TaxID=1218801 RepID=A0A7L4ZJD6_9FLAO|nr:hypothetical protein [Kordia antarctica]QHI36034.1 hypothetical protein IMCC3317_13870 [Kordia antarctica]